MGLVTEKKVKIFDTSAISKGCLICIECPLWNTEKRGIVTRVTDSCIEFEFIVDMTNVSNRCVVNAEDIEGCIVRWTEDMKTINTYPEVAEDDT